MKERGNDDSPIIVDNVVVGKEFTRHDSVHSSEKEIRIPYTKKVEFVTVLDKSTGDIILISRKEALEQGIHLEDWNQVSINTAQDNYDKTNTSQTIENFMILSLALIES